MSTINTIIQIQNQSNGMAFPVTSSRSTDKPGSSVAEITVGTTEEAVASEYTSPRNVLLRLVSGGDVQVGISTGVYPFRLSGADDAMVLRLDVEGIVETQTVTVTAEDANTTLHEQFFSLEGSSGTWGVWFDIGGGGVDPTGAYDNSLEITGIIAADTIATVGAQLYAEMIASAAFLADFNIAYDSGTNKITITDRHTGTRANIADGTATTGFTFATTQPGEASPTVYLKSASTSQVLVGVIPN